MTGMRIPYQLVPDDYAAYTAHVYDTGGRARRNVRGQRALFLIIGACSAGFSLAARGRLSLADLVFLGAVGAWVVYLPAWYARSMAKRMRAAATSMLSRGAVGAQELLVDDAGIAARSEFGTLQRNWNGVIGVDESPTHLFVHYAESAAFILPKSWLGEIAPSLRAAVERGIASARSGTVG